MEGALRIIGSFALAAAATVAIIWIWPMPVHAQEPSCTPPEQVKVIVQGSPLLQWLGVVRLPYTDTEAVFFRRADGQTMMSPISKDNCVAPFFIEVGAYRDEQFGMVEGQPRPAPFPAWREPLLFIGKMRSDFLELNSLR